MEGSITFHNVQPAANIFEEEDFVFTTVESSRRPSMPICMRTSAWCLFTLEFTCKWRRIIFRSSNTAYHRQYGSVFQKNAQFTGELNHFTILGTGPNITPRFGSIFDVQVSRKSNMSSTAMSQRMVWVDLEMTGLDIEKDQIIEMACIITDSDLNILAEGPNLIINQPDKLLEGMSEWCKEHHGKSGLTQAVRDSKITLEQAEYEFLSFLRQHTPPGQCPLAGNSVHADKRFLDKYMPQFMYHLHYRIIDVSTIKELCRHLFGPHVECSSKQNQLQTCKGFSSRRWFPEAYKMVPHKKATHRALGDIYESIKELQYYRANVFKVSTMETKCKIVENGGSNNS